MARYKGANYAQYFYVTVLVGPWPSCTGIYKRELLGRLLARKVNKYDVKTLPASNNSDWAATVKTTPIVSYMLPGYYR